MNHFPEDTIKLVQPTSSHNHLEPCPFCGCRVITYEQYQHKAGIRWRVWCTECLACIDPGYAQHPGVVQRMWNRRNKPNADHS